MVLGLKSRGIKVNPHKIKNINNYETVAYDRKDNGSMVVIGTSCDCISSLPDLL